MNLERSRNWEGEPTGSRSQAGAEALNLSWQPPRGLWSLAISNALLRIVTIGVHHFWGRTEVRRRLWNGIRINDEPLVYTGTGFELFRGFVIVALILFLPLAIVSIGAALLSGGDPLVIRMTSFGITLVTFMLYPIAVFRSQRYRLSRTRWRGIRFGLHGSALGYAFTWWWTSVLVSPTFGWIIPWRNTQLQKRINDTTTFGNEPFAFSARSGPLYPSFAVMWFGVILLFIVCSVAITATMAIIRGDTPTLMLESQDKMLMAGAALAILVFGYLIYAIATAWFRAKTFNHFSRSTTVANARFEAQVTGRGFVWLAVTNFLIKLACLVVGLAICTLIGALAYGVSLQVTGSDDETRKLFMSVAPPLMLLFAGLFFVLPTPVTEARRLRYIVSNMTIVGDADLGRIAQQAASDGSGEGLADAFEIDAL